jgi:hypothetical protein
MQSHAPELEHRRRPGADIALNTFLEDLDGRIEELGEQFADMVSDGGQWGQDVADDLQVSFVAYSSAGASCGFCSE